VSTRGTQSVWLGLDGGSRASALAWATSFKDSAGVILTLGLSVSTNSACGISSVLAGALCFASESVTCTFPNSATLSALLRVISYNRVARTFLQVGQSIFVRLDERVRYGVHCVRGMRAWLPVDRAENTMFGDGLESLEQTQSFQDTAADCQVVQRDLGFESATKGRKKRLCAERTCWTSPSPSMMNMPRRLTPSSSTSTP
jgi:hypothetical protein